MAGSSCQGVVLPGGMRAPRGEKFWQNGSRDGRLGARIYGVSWSRFDHGADEVRPGSSVLGGRLQGWSELRPICGKRDSWGLVSAGHKGERRARRLYWVTARVNSLALLKLGGTWRAESPSVSDGMLGANVEESERAWIEEERGASRIMGKRQSAEV